MRHRSSRLPGEASPDPDLIARLRAARLYVITPDRDPDVLADLASAALRGGADVVQLRHKQLARGELLQVAVRLRDLASAAGALFIVNDHLDIAMMSSADGVHLGPDDIGLASARRVGGDQILIGASASTLEVARAAIGEGADYIGCGPAFSTPIKKEKAVIGPDGVAAVAAGISEPVFAIGGIDASNLAQLTAFGLLRVCVIRAIADAPDAESATRRLRTMLDD